MLAIVWSSFSRKNSAVFLSFSIGRIEILGSHDARYQRETSACIESRGATAGTAAVATPCNNANFGCSSSTSKRSSRSGLFFAGAPLCAVAIDMPGRVLPPLKAVWQHLPIFACSAQQARDSAVRLILTTWVDMSTRQIPRSGAAGETKVEGTGAPLHLMTKARSALRVLDYVASAPYLSPEIPLFNVPRRRDAQFLDAVSNERFAEAADLCERCAPPAAVLPQADRGSPISHVFFMRSTSL